MVVAKYDLGVFVEPDDFEKSLRGASKFVPNSGHVVMQGKKSGWSDFLSAPAAGRVEGVPPDRPCGEQRGLGAEPPL